MLGVVDEIGESRTYLIGANSLNRNSARTTAGGLLLRHAAVGDSCAAGARGRSAHVVGLRSQRITAGAALPVATRLTIGREHIAKVGAVAHLSVVDAAAAAATGRAGGLIRGIQTVVTAATLCSRLIGGAREHAGCIESIIEYVDRRIRRLRYRVVDCVVQI